MEPAIRLLIVAADPLVRAGLALLFEETAESKVIGTFSPELMLAYQGDEYPVQAADVIIWDLGWQSGSLEGFDLQDIDVPIISLVSDSDQAEEAWRAGCKSIFSREVDLDTLVAATKAVTCGLVAFDLSSISALVPSSPRLPEDLERTLTAREMEVVRLLAAGLTNRAIASELGISEHTVKFHVNAILGKLNAQSRTEAVVIATKIGLIVL